MFIFENDDGSLVTSQILIWILQRRRPQKSAPSVQIDAGILRTLAEFVQKLVDAALSRLFRQEPLFRQQTFHLHHANATQRRRVKNN